MTSYYYSKTMVGVKHIIDNYFSVLLRLNTRISVTTHPYLCGDIIALYRMLNGTSLEYEFGKVGVFGDVFQFFAHEVGRDCYRFVFSLRGLE